MTGFSTPIFGVSWEAPVVDREVALRLVTFLEDRTALWSTRGPEIAVHVVRSTQRIRELATELLSAGGISPELEQPLRAIRAACQEFVDDLRIDPSNPDDRALRKLQPDLLTSPTVHRLEPNEYWATPDVLAVARFNQALGRLRAMVGVQLGLIATRFGLDIDEHLARILPPTDG